MHAWLHLSTPAADSPATWWTATGAPAQGNLEQAAEALAGHALTLLLPAEAASLHSVEVPARSGRWLRQAVRSALEERLLDDLDRLHLAQGQLQQGRQCRVIALDRAWLSACLERLSAVGLTPRRIHLDADCLPPGQPLALRCAGRWLVGGAPGLCDALDDETLAASAALLPSDLQQREDEPWALLAEGSRQAIDLRQGEFAGGDRRAMPWGTLALLLVLAGSGQWLHDRMQRQALEQANATLEAENLAQWQARVPDEPRVVDLERQVRARLAKADQPDADLARSLEHLARTWSAGGGALAKVQRLDYQAGEGWTLRVGSASFADLERLREGLTGQGLAVQSDAGARDAQGVSARLQIATP